MMGCLCTYLAHTLDEERLRAYPSAMTLLEAAFGKHDVL